ncbi:hypothetical protein PsAD14_03679 [Pseudovibrio sp. Ad14]|nr:hypothetical protein PsW74_04098 [Pseudovibrio sp. W74]KZL07296.1 hypothetical protein PsAD14_03679 [Pseudovibrio sp. Ad14]
MVYPLAEQRLAQQHSAAHDLNLLEGKARIVLPGKISRLQCFLHHNGL